MKKNPTRSAEEVRKDLCGGSSIDKFEYGYSSTLVTLAKMVLGEQLSSWDKLIAIRCIDKHVGLDQPLQLIYYGASGTGKSFTIDKATDEKNSVRTTFPPDSRWERRVFDF